MTIKLLAMDLDGTLVDEQSRMLPANREAIMAARQAGISVVLATGRSWKGTKPVYESLGLTGPAICYLGALVVADGSGRVLSHRTLPPGAWEAVREFALREGLSVTACIGTDQAVADGMLPSHHLVAADVAVSTRRADDFPNWDFWHPYTLIMDPELAPCVAPPIMLAVYGEKDVRRALTAFPDGLSDSQFDLYDKVAGETVLHIWHHTVSKGQALAQVCARMGVQPDEVAAFGDMPMDASMLEFAGIGVAVPTAHTALKAVATWVMEPHEAIRRILEGD